MQWAYRTERFDSSFGVWRGTQFDTGNMNGILNELGGEGWELISVFDVNSREGRSKHFVAIFKRPIS